MFEQLACESAKALMAKTPDLVVLDIRDQASYEANHIPGAQAVSVDQLTGMANTINKQQPILVYCYHGISSQSVAQHLVEQGFEQVYSLIGGMEAWSAEAGNASY